MDKEIILKVENLSILMKERFLLKGVNLQLHKGECIGIVGEDKSGKSSLLKAISGSLPIKKGQVFVDGVDIFENKAALRGVGVCLDPPVFFKYQSVYDNLKFICMLNGREDKEKIKQVLEQFHLSHRSKSRVLFLSYFEKKLMSIAITFLTEQKILLLDEPYKGLSETDAKIIRKLIQDARAAGAAVIICSSKFEDLEGECDRYLLMQNRQIAKELSAEECEQLSSLQNFCFVKVKFPHYAGKIIQNEFGIKVKILGKKVLFEDNEDLTTQIIKTLTVKRFPVYSAGVLNKKSERIFANLAPLFKEEEA